jgi:hypothetical protein
MKNFFIIALTLLYAQFSYAQEKNISNGNVFEGEPFIAVNLNNNQHLVAAWMGFVLGQTGRLSIKVKTSFDGGRNWSSTYAIPHVVSTYKSADPSLAFDKNGNLFLCFIDYRESPDSGGVYVLKSTDGGLNWGNPVKVIDAYDDGSKRPIDRPWMSVNENGDKLYITTKPAPWIPAPNRPYFTSSVDSGLTWRQLRYIDSTGFLVGNQIAGPMPAPAAVGDLVYAVYPSYFPSESPYARFIIAKSDNAGNGFGYSVVLNGTTPANNDTAKTGYQLLINPSNTNHLTFLYLYRYNGGDMDVMLTESLNAGTTWTTPIRINDDAVGNGKMQDMIWGSFDKDGDLIISWRDRRNASGSGYATASEFYAAFRDKDSVNFSQNFKLSDTLVDFNNILLESGNDFMCIDLTDDTISAVWGNTKDGSLDIWFVRIVAKTGQITSINLLGSESVNISVFPNPSTGVFIIKMNEHSSKIQYQVLNQEGKLIAESTTFSDEFKIDLTNQPKGIYFLKVKTDKGIVEKKLAR